MSAHLTYRLIHPDTAMEWPFGMVAMRLGTTGEEVLLTKNEVGELTIAINAISAAMKAQAVARPGRGGRGTFTRAIIEAAIARKINGQ